LNELDKALKSIEEIDETLGPEDDEDTPKTATRKIRFDSGKLPNSVEGRFFKPHTLDELGLEELALGRMILASRGSEMPDDYETKFQSLADKVRKYTMTTGGTGTGAELIDTLMWTNLWRDVVSSTLVADLFTPWLPMSSKEEELPSMGNVTFYKPAGEGQAVTATDLATAKRKITAYTIKAQVDISDEEDEDAVIAMLPEIREILRRNAREVIDSVILNADTTGASANINKYGAAVDGNEDYLLGFDGLIHYCLNEVTGQKSDLGVLATTDFVTLIGLLGKYADKPSRCAFILDRGVKNKAIQLDDFRTVDKLGQRATLLTGQLGTVYDIPVVLSSQMLKSDANGRIDGATPGNNTLGRILLVNRDMWKFGIRRNIRIATQRDEPKTLTSIVASLRIGLQCYGDRASADYCHTALGYNVTV
jgi:HK97 family phage major capsid protein